MSTTTSSVSGSSGGTVMGMMKDIESWQNFEMSVRSSIRQATTARSLPNSPIDVHASSAPPSLGSSPYMRVPTHASSPSALPGTGRSSSSSSSSSPTTSPPLTEHSPVLPVRMHSGASDASSMHARSSSQPPPTQQHHSPTRTPQPFSPTHLDVPLQSQSSLLSSSQSQYLHRHLAIVQQPLQLQHQQQQQHPQYQRQVDHPSAAVSPRLSSRSFLSSPSAAGARDRRHQHQRPSSVPASPSRRSRSPRSSPHRQQIPSKASSNTPPPPYSPSPTPAEVDEAEFELLRRHRLDKDEDELGAHHHRRHHHHNLQSFDDGDRAHDDGNDAIGAEDDWFVDAREFSSAAASPARFLNGGGGGGSHNSRNNSTNSGGSVAADTVPQSMKILNMITLDDRQHAGQSVVEVGQYDRDDERHHDEDDDAKEDSDDEDDAISRGVAWFNVHRNTNNNNSNEPQQHQLMPQYHEHDPRWPEDDAEPNQDSPPGNAAAANIDTAAGERSILLHALAQSRDVGSVLRARVVELSHEVEALVVRERRAVEAAKAAREEARAWRREAEAAVREVRRLRRTMVVPDGGFNHDDILP